jgi:response regulator of citrate/malate metabolism
MTDSPEHIKTIGMIEDNKSIQDILRRVMGGEPRLKLVYQAYTPEEARKAIEEHAVDGLILDGSLTSKSDLGSEGEELVPLVRARNPDTKIIWTSTHKYTGEIPIDVEMPKPFEVFDLLAVMMRLLAIEE